MNEDQKWLVTVRAIPTKVDFAGNLFVGNPITKTILIDEHPAVYLVESRKAHEALLQMKRENSRADREEILWATKLPEGILTDEQELVLI